ncbi:hypothetical protein GBZ48_10465 [Azospirillum melinis]|uniref:Uncharacterized protein n=1 Tax=Azospirillum melinis TaxID=328839 RepID=A0ABX2K828_9PROT|nr:hypothetical protein [Azospirillum melinis]MBP2304749.1 hypothetical protein [Azospirillum melinis]NUA99716.1 hypothetical protein [Azospirillum melinis]
MSAFIWLFKALGNLLSGKPPEPKNDNKIERLIYTALRGASVLTIAGGIACAGVLAVKQPQPDQMSCTGSLLKQKTADASSMTLVAKVE